MVRKLEKGGKAKRSYTERTKEGTEEVREGLRKELDALVSPISLRKENITHEKIKTWAEKGADNKSPEALLVKGPSALEKPIRKEQCEPSKKKVNPWGIVIGETD